MKCLTAITIALLMATAAFALTETDVKESLRSDDPEIRSDTCLSLAGEGEAAIPLLVPLLKDDSMLVRHCAAYALSRIGGEEVARTFREGLKSKSYDVRRVSALGLGMIGRSGTLEAVSPLLKDKNWEVRWSAAFALGRSNDRRALPFLGPVAESDSYYDKVAATYPVREAAASAIGRLNGAIGWSREPVAAKGKPTLLYFRKSGSPLCAKFESLVFGEEKVVDAAQRFSSVWLDHMVAPALFIEYGVTKVPAIVFLTPSGVEVERVDGTIAPSDLQARMLGVIEKEKSVSRLRSRRAKDPRDFEAAWQLAELFMDEGVWDKALKNLEVIIEGDPYNRSSLLDNALFARAYIKGKEGDFKGSRREFKELVDRFPAFGDRAQALYCWGLSCLKAGKIEEGKGAFRKLVKEYPDGHLSETATALLKKLPRP